MKNKLFSILFLTGTNLFAQQVQTGSPPPATVPLEAAAAWYRGGNFLTGTAGANNNFGTMWNSPIYTKTNSALREKLNGTLNIAGAPQYTINGFNALDGVNTSGYLWLGPDAPVGGGGTYYNNKGAFSMLHLNGTTTLAAIELGYRPWMKVGVTFTENSDLMYFEVRTLPTVAEESEMVVSWSDNPPGSEFQFLFS